MCRLAILAVVLTAWIAGICSVTEAASSEEPQSSVGIQGIRVAVANLSGSPATAPVESRALAGNETRRAEPETAEHVQKSGMGEGSPPPGKIDTPSSGGGEPEPAIRYESKTQREKCESYRQNLKDRFLKARYFSIQGDPCATAEHAKAFVGLVDACPKECPKDFVKKAGFSDRTLRNIKLLYKHGSERCLK